MSEMMDAGLAGRALAMLTKTLDEAQAEIARLKQALRQAEAERDELQGDAATLRGYIRTYRETPTMTASLRDHWRARAERAEAERDELAARIANALA